jgi:hypothetical protein
MPREPDPGIEFHYRRKLNKFCTGRSKTGQYQNANFKIRLFFQSLVAQLTTSPWRHDRRPDPKPVSKVEPIK